MRFPVPAIAIMVLACLLIAACVTSSDVVPMGKDSFMLTATARGAIVAGQEHIEGIKKANIYCSASGKNMIVQRMDTSGIAGYGPVTTTLIFSCVSADDPEYQRPDLRQDPNVRIDN